LTVPSLERLAHRVLMGAFAGTGLPDWAARLVDDGLGSVCVFGSNVASAAQLARLTGALHDRAPELLVATDEEGGDVTRLHVLEGSPHPGNAALGAVDDTALTERVSRSLGTELAAAGIDLDLAPVADANTDPANPVIGVRSFGADPALVARHTAAYVVGLQSAGVGACVKHFPGHGDTHVDSHLALPVVKASPDVLRARELVPFGAAVAAGSVAVMTSHVLLPALDPHLPATLSPTVLAVLRDELGFGGLVVSDAVDMRGASAGRGEPAAAVLALAAGCDLVCLGADKDADLHTRVVAAVVDAVRDGTLPEARLADAADRVLAASRTIRALQDHAGPDVDGEASAEVARRAVHVEGRLPAGLREATVLRFRTGSNIAVGDVPWGLPRDGLILGGRPVVDVLESTESAEALAAAGDGPVVALARAPHQHPWVTALLRDLAARCPQLVTVEMGWPGEVVLPGAAVVTTYGAGRVNGVALDRVLAGAP
jgi:beta-N-acetylhexosaminidase